MAVPADIYAWIHELFQDIGGISWRAMMGGLAIYSEGRIFAIFGGPERQLYIKAVGPLAEDLAREGASRFSYIHRSGRRMEMGYWTLPDAALDDPDAACAWARRSLAASDPDFS